MPIRTWNLIRSILLIPALVAAQPSNTQQTTRSVPDPSVISTGQGLTPAGIESIFDGRPQSVAFAADGTLWVAAAIGHNRALQLDYRHNQIQQTIPLPGWPIAQSLVMDETSGGPLVAVLVRQVQSSSTSILGIRGGAANVLASKIGQENAGRLAVSKRAANGEQIAVVPLPATNEIAVVDVSSGRTVSKIKTGIAPFAAVINDSGTTAYISNLGGRFAKTGERTAPSGNLHISHPSMIPTEPIVVDARGVPASGTVARINLQTGAVEREIEVGLHPSAMYWDQAQSRLYVTNGNSDSVSVINTQTDAVTQTIALQPFSRSTPGVAPTALVASPDGKTLFVACGGLNAVAVVDTATGTVKGLIPTGWYPADIALNHDGTMLAIANLRGVGPGYELNFTPQFIKEDGLTAKPGIGARSVFSHRGSVQVVRVPTDAELANYTTAVAVNNHMVVPELKPPANKAVRQTAAPEPIPQRAGEPSPIDHVVFIIKENRTYDQVLGDIGIGNSDPSLTAYGRAVTPNQHRLAEQFVVLDNFYANGDASQEGHAWSTQANVPEYIYWLGFWGRSNGFDGTDPLTYSKGGFLWDLALATKKSVQVFGEMAGAGLDSTPNGDRRSGLLQAWQQGAAPPKVQQEAQIAPLNRILVHDYPSWNLDYPDVVRAQIFQRHLADWERSGSMPNLVILQLPSNHTSGTAEGYSTPKAMVADNDYALGQIVEGLSHSQFWKRMAIFVVEDDAQNGLDHVDGHRTVALVASPYARRGATDSTFYNQTSILKSIELILGLPTLSLFDLIAPDMRASFTDKPDPTSYVAVRPEQSLFDRNPPLSALHGQARKDAIASSKMDFSEPDEAPWDTLNRILWRNAFGLSKAYPGPSQTLFHLGN